VRTQGIESVEQCATQGFNLVKQDHQENTSNLTNLLTQEVARESKEITDLDSLDHAYVVALNKIDEDRKANLIKSIFKMLPPIRFQRCPPFGATVLSQCTPICAG
jgi:hypothetical protein